MAVGKVTDISWTRSSRSSGMGTSPRSIWSDVTAMPSPPKRSVTRPAAHFPAMGLSFTARFNRPENEHGPGLAAVRLQR